MRYVRGVRREDRPHSRTLNGLKRLMEVSARGGGSLSVVLIGHPKLRNDLRRPSMEEIGHRTDILSFEGLGEEAHVKTHAKKIDNVSSPELRKRTGGREHSLAV